MCFNLKSVTGTWRLLSSTVKTLINTLEEQLECTAYVKRTFKYSCSTTLVQLFLPFLYFTFVICCKYYNLQCSTFSLKLAMKYLQLLASFMLSQKSKRAAEKNFTDDDDDDDDTCLSDIS